MRFLQVTAFLALSGILTLPVEAKPRVRIAGVSVGAGYSRGWGYPGFGCAQPFSFGAYDPLCYGPFYHPGYYNGFAYQPNMGEVRFRTAPPKNAMVYVDGAYAGEASRLKHMWLEPGAYNIEVRAEGQPSFEKRVYVLSGKTLDLRPEGGRK